MSLTQEKAEQSLPPLASVQESSRNTLIYLVMVSHDDTIFVPPFACMYLSSALKTAGYRPVVRHILPPDIPKTAAEIVAARPLFAGFSVFSGPDTTQSARMSMVLRKADPSLPIVWGGIHPSLLPHECLREDFIDLVCTFEGEELVVELADRLSRGLSVEDLMGLGYKKNGQTFVNARRPFLKGLGQYRLDFSSIDIERYIQEEVAMFEGVPVRLRSIGYVTSRGCPFDCTFCYNQTYNLRRWRRFPLDVVAEDIEMLKREYGITAITFWDDIFFVNKKRVKEVLEKLQVPSYIEIRFDSIDEEVGEILRRHRCNLLLGAESGNDRILNLIDKRFSVEDARRKVEILAKNHVPALYSFILGLPSETREEMQDTLNFIVWIARRHQEASFTVGAYMPYPGTELYEKAKEYGFEPPRKTEDWHLIDRWRNTVPLPWLDEKVALHIRLICSIMSWRWPLVTQWMYYRLKKGILRFNLDFKILIRLYHLMARIKKWFNRRSVRVARPKGMRVDGPPATRVEILPDKVVEGVPAPAPAAQEAVQQGAA